MFGIRKGIRRLVGRGQKNTAPPQNTAPRAAAPPKREAAAAPKAQPQAQPQQGSIAAALSAQTEAQHKAAPDAAPPKKDAAPSAAPKLSGIAALIAAGAADENEIDLSVSYTSGPAAEAAAKAMAERDMLQTADDGEQFWGPVDNDSARSKARGEELIIDQEECIHCGTCVENTEQVFVLPDDSKAVVIAQEGPMELIQDAIDACPVTCIHWTDDPEQFPQINDAEGRELS